MRTCLVLTLLALLVSPTLAGDSWPQFRGPSGQGIAEASGTPLTWSETENVAWKTKIPGRGWSSPVVLDGQIWLTTAVESALPESIKKERLAKEKMANQMALAGKLSLRAVAVDLKSGKLLHDVELFSVENPDAIHSLNSYASPTPVIEPGKVWCHFGTFGTACIDTATGKVLWRERLPVQHNVGPGSSPVLYKELLILTCDGADTQYVAALDKATGATVWKTKRPPMAGNDGDLHKAYSTPLVVNVGGADQVVIPGAQWVVSYEPISGEPIWQVNYAPGFSNVPRPVFGDGVVYVCSGYMKPNLLAIRANGRGDVTESHVAWKQDKQIPDQPSPLLVDGRLYMISSQGVATCIKSDSGDQLWRERLAGNYSASPLFAAGHVYFCSQEGKTTVLAAGDEFEVLAENRLDGQLMASPAVIDSALLLRTDSHLYRVETNRAVGSTGR